jgi:restriction system protein
MVRAESGIYYEDFLLNNYIAIGWNEISIKDIEETSYNSDLLRSKLIILNNLANTTKNKRRMGSAAKQLIRFKESIKEGSIVLVPSENSIQFAVGIVTGPVYFEKNEDSLSDTHCPYTKRRPLEWVGTFNRNQADSALQKIIYAAHAISDITPYKGYINRALFDTYVEGNQMHMTFNIKHQDSIELEPLADLLQSYKDMQKLLFPNEKLTIRLNLQSPGPIEIIGAVTTIGSIAGLVWYNSDIASAIKTEGAKVLKNGGKFSFGKNGLSVELPNREEKENEQKNRERELKMAEDVHEMDMIERKIDIMSKAASMAEKFGYNLETLDGFLPTEFTKALEAQQKDKNNTLNSSKNDHPIKLT